MKTRQPIGCRVVISARPERGEALQKRLQEVVHLRQAVALQGLAGLGGGLPELVVPGLELLQALDIAESLSAAFTSAATSGSWMVRMER